MSDDLRADTVRVMMSDMCVRLFRVSILLMMYTYQRLCIDSFLFRSKSTPPNIPKDGRSSITPSLLSRSL